MGLFSLGAFKRQEKAVSDILNFAALVSDGVLLCKSGALLGGFFYRGRDLQASTHAERNYITERVNAALSRLGNGWVLWQDAIRIKSPGYPNASASHFPDPISRMIDEERRATFTADSATFESEYAMVLMYTPPKRSQTRLAELVYDDDDKSEQSKDTLQTTITHFERALTDITDFLGDILRLRRMTCVPVELADSNDVPGGAKTSVLRSDLLTYLQFCVTGVMQPMAVPPVPMYLDAVIGGQELHTGDTPKIGGLFVGAVSIEGFPNETFPNMLDSLDNLAIEYRWSSRFIFLDQQNGLTLLERFRRKWKQKEKGFFAAVFKTNGQTNEDAVDMTRATQEAIKDQQSNVVTFGYYTPVITVFAPTREKRDEHLRLVQREIRRLGFSARIETLNTMETWLGSVPGHPEPNVRRPLLHTLNVADLLPLASVWPGRAEAPCPLYAPHSPPLMYGATSGATPFRLNLHVGDVGHALIFGPTGAGKSTLLALIAAQFRRYKDAQVFVFDKGRSMYPLTEAMGGKHYDLMSESSEKNREGFCPLQFLEGDSDVAWACEWIATMVELQTDKPTTPRQKEEIFRAISLLRKSPEGRSLTDLSTNLQDEELRSALRYYSISGQLGHLLDSETDGLKGDPFSVFEIEELMEAGEKTVIPVLLYLFRRFQKKLDGRPSALLLDEAWIMLGHPVFRDKIKDWLKTMRRANCIVVLATQSLSDAANSGIFDVLIESCPSKILLPNEDADKAGTLNVVGPRDLYVSMGLNDTEINIIRSAQKKKHYYYTSSEGRRLFELALGPRTLAFVGASDKDQLRRVKQLVATHGQQWPLAWLHEKGVK